MQLTDLQKEIKEWLGSGGNSLSLSIDTLSIGLQRRAGTGVCVARLNVAAPLDDRLLLKALLLTRSALKQFGIHAAALALDPDTERLCLLRCFHDDDPQHIMGIIEDLSNQCDIWQEILDIHLSPARSTRAVINTRGERRV